MIDVLEAGRELQAFCDAQEWKSCFIGGLAVLRWGEPRVTRDVDLSLLTGFGDEGGFIDALTNVFPPRSPDAAAFARRRRTLLLQTAKGVGIDISLAGLPFEQSAIERATPFRFDAEIELRTCSAEDLMVYKLFACRAIDIRDAEGIVLRNQLDWNYIEQWLLPLAELKEDPEVMRAFERIRRYGR